MARRFNYTGRKKLSRSHARIVLHPESSGGTFDAVLKLDGYGFPGAAQVFVEAYRQASWMRFDFGTIQNPKVPSDRRLTVFDNLEAVLFRIKVVAPGEHHGSLIGVLDQIRPSSAEDAYEDRIPLLPIKSQDIGDLVWRVDLEERPLLLINNKIGGESAAIARTPGFMSLVYSAAFREVLYRAVVEDGHRDTEDSDDWKSQWLKFATLIPGVGSELPGDEVDNARDWVDDAVQAFSRQQSLREKFAGSWNESVES